MYFKAWKRCMLEFEVNPEFNTSGNLHYHGYYIIKDAYKWYSKVLPKMKYHGFIKINEVKSDLASALNYSRKDREIMIKSLDYAVPYTHEVKVVKTKQQVSIELDNGITSFYPIKK